MCTGTLPMPVATARTVEGSISGGNWVTMESRMSGCSPDRVRCTVTSHPAHVLSAGRGGEALVLAILGAVYVSREWYG